jgi:hypothetical protein
MKSMQVSRTLCTSFAMKFQQDCLTFTMSKAYWHEFIASVSNQTISYENLRRDFPESYVFFFKATPVFMCLWTLELFFFNPRRLKIQRQTINTVNSFNVPVSNISTPLKLDFHPRTCWSSKLVGNHDLRRQLSQSKLRSW